MDILGKRYLFFAISLLVIVPGLILLGVSAASPEGLPLSIDFTGGTLLEVSFGSGAAPAPAQVIEVYQDLGIDDVQVQTSGRDIIIARSPFLDDAARAQLVERMAERFDDTVNVRRFDSVGPTVGREVATRAAIAVGVAAAIVVIYITFAFRRIPHAFRYGVCAII